MLSDGGPATVADSVFESFRPSPVHTAPLASQLVVAGRTIVTSSLAASGLTLIFHVRLGCMPWCSWCGLSSRWALVTRAFVTVNAWSRIVR